MDGGGEEEAGSVSAADTAASADTAEVVAARNWSGSHALEAGTAGFGAVPSGSCCAIRGPLLDAVGTLGLPVAIASAADK